MLHYVLRETELKSHANPNPNPVTKDGKWAMT